MSVSVRVAMREPTVKMVLVTSILVFLQVVTFLNHIHHESCHIYLHNHHFHQCGKSFLHYQRCPFLSLSLSLSRYTPTVEIVACASSPCQNGATCFDHNGGSGYVCLCPAGFEGTNCENGTYIYHFYFLYFLTLITFSNTFIMKPVICHFYKHDHHYFLHCEKSRTCYTCNWY